MLRKYATEIQAVAAAFFMKKGSVMEPFSVPKAGLEPARCCHHTPLKRARLPIPPLRRSVFADANIKSF